MPPQELLQPYHVPQVVHQLLYVVCQLFHLAQHVFAVVHWVPQAFFVTLSVRQLFTASLVILLTSLQPVTSGPRYSSRIVDTASGAIRGVIVELNSRHLEPVEVFRGVPYAAPPVGPLRFRPPQPPQHWPGVRLAETFGAVCPQRPPDLSNRTTALMNMPKARYNYLKKFVPLLANYSEDCLFMNIYIPGSGNRGLEAPYAVLFFIHGESFEWGSGNPYDGSVLASYGHVIVITVNYRLGMLGFLRTRPVPSTASAAGRTGGSVSNLALFDLVAALRWIRANIGAFGGDASRVTLIGHGTGAALANLLLVLPSARGLFTRAALLSGSALSPWATASDPDSLRKSVANHMGCNTQEDEDISSCLRTRSVETLLDVQTAVPVARFMSRFAPTLPLEETAGPAGLMTPALAMERASDTFITSQLLLSVANTESYADFSASDIQYGFEEEQRNRVLRTYIRNAYVYHLNEIFSAVRNEYTDWDKPIQHPINIRDSTLEALSDGHTVAPLVRVAYLHARRGARTYLGHFGYQSKDSDFPQRLGTVRGEDIAFITGLPLVVRNFSRQDATVAEAVMTHFTNFAKSGDPNTASAASNTAQHQQQQQQQRAKHRTLQWDTYETGTQLYMSITTKPKMKSHYRGHKIALWLNLIPQLHQPGDEDVSMRHHHFHEREPHYYAGAIRPESFTRLPPPLHPASMTDSYITSSSSSSEGSSTECLTDSTTEDGLHEVPIIASEVEEDEMLQHLTTRQYYSYTAALGVTVGVGCLLLVLNMLIFAGIYYQRDRDRKRQQNNSSSTSHSSESIVLSARPQTNGDYLNLSKSTPVLDALDSTKSSSKNKNNKPPPPKPPVRTSSNPSTSNVKKRVQIQEISL